MCKAIGKGCEWKHPRTPSVRLLWDERVEAVSEFLRTTRVGCTGTEGGTPEEEGEDSENEAGLDPPYVVSFLCLSFVFPLFSSPWFEQLGALFLSSFLCIFLRGVGEPYYDRSGRFVCL